jgi:hypothetical protein
VARGSALTAIASMEMTAGDPRFRHAGANVGRPFDYRICGGGPAGGKLPICLDHGFSERPLSQEQLHHGLMNRRK